MSTSSLHFLLASIIHAASTSTGRERARGPLKQCALARGGAVALLLLTVWENIENERERDVIVAI